MKEWLAAASEHVIIVIDAIAFVVVVIGTVEACIGGLRAMLGSASARERRDVWLGYSRWLVAALTFQLAADIIETSITASMEAIIRIGAVAVIRTLLNYFLERDIGEMRERQREVAAGKVAA